MKIAFVQMNCLFGQVETNLAKAKFFIESAEADLFVLPELFNSGYLFQSKQELHDLAEPENGKTITFLAEMCQRKKCHIVAGFTEQANNTFYNSCALISPNGPLATYRKIHLFHTEKNWFTPGDKPFFIMDIGVAKIGMMICFDWIFPESMRSLALLGADVICHPANLVLPYCQKAMVTRCLENNAFAVTANRIGSDKRDKTSIDFTGQSQITGPRGDILASASVDEEDVRVVDIDISAARDKQLNPQNNLFDDRRPDMYLI